MGVDFYSYYGLCGTCFIGVRLDLRYKKSIGLLYFMVNTITVLKKIAYILYICYIVFLVYFCFVNVYKRYVTNCYVVKYWWFNQTKTNVVMNVNVNFILIIVLRVQILKEHFIFAHIMVLFPFIWLCFMKIVNVYKYKPFIKKLNFFSTFINVLQKCIMYLWFYIFIQ